MAEIVVDDMVRGAMNSLVGDEEVSRENQNEVP